MNNQQALIILVRDHQSTGGSSVATTTAEKKEIRESIESNLKTLLDFKKSLLEEQKTGEQRIVELNTQIENTKEEIDKRRIELEDLRIKLKEINEQKDKEYPKFVELRDSITEARKQLKSLDEKANNVSASRFRRERSDIANLTRMLEQIERDIQIKKLSKDEERKLVAKSKEIATKLHASKMMHKKEDQYRQMASQYDSIRNSIKIIFDKKTELGNAIGKLKENLDSLLNQRESLYEERRKIIYSVREAAAKMEMVETQLNAIEFRKTKLQSMENRRKRDFHDRKERYESKHERNKLTKETQERWNLLKEEATKKLSSGEKLSFEEMKLIYSDGAD